MFVEVVLDLYMKKIFLSFGLIVTFALFATFSRRNVGISADRFLTPNVSILANNTLATISNPAPVVPTSEPIPTPVVTTTTSTPKPIPTPTPAPTPKPLGEYKDGSYTGSVVDAFYGNIQAKAVVRGGKLTDVIFLQYPSDRRTSVQINTQAMPYLKSEAIQSQSANVNTVSGASDSSQAFRESLGSALAIAKN